MKFKGFLFSLLSLLIAVESSAETLGTPSDTRPNILLIVADDLGFSDLGSFGSNISTPALDQIADEGLRFSNFYVLPTCSPTRSALLTGNDNHVAGLGVMPEFVYPDIENLPGYSGHLSDQVATIPEILQANGYHTYMAGKWHLGEDDEQSPYRRGFEETFALMNGGGSHWSDMRSLSRDETMIYRQNGQVISKLPEDFYSTKNYTDTLISFIDQNRNDGKPFFAYLSYTAPHDPLHAPADYIAKYRGEFDDGWDVLRSDRLEGLKEQGIVPADLTNLPGNFMVPDWKSLSEDHRHEVIRDMEVYAAMVDYMDMSIGRLIEYLKKHGMYVNTLILFFSDNGANGAPATAYPGNSDGKYLGTFNNSLENRGSEGSFIDMGPGWAQAVSSPFRLYKSFTTEGGIKSPLLIKMPGSTGNKGAWNHSFVHVTDILPTFLELAQSEYPDVVKGKPVRQPIGKSMLPLLTGTRDNLHGDSGIGYELFEMKAYIQGEWKILRLPVPFGNGVWALYNIAADPGEVHDLSDKHPNKKAELIKAWQKYAEDNELYDHKGRFDALYRKAYGVDG